MHTQRWKITLEYDGAPFVGWQRQRGDAPSVQGAVEAALYAFCQQHITVHGAGRTDAGVHAAGQVAHFDLAYGQRPLEAAILMKALNALVRPLPIAVLDAQCVPPDFHARFGAREKLYRYRIVNRKAPPALVAGHVWHIHSPLHVEAMQGAAKYLTGHHDFTSFRDSHCQAKSPMRTLDALDIECQGQEIIVWARARSFLHHQVRIIVGTLVKVGQEHWIPEDVKRALEACNRCAAGPTAPAQGLTLINVQYKGSWG